MNKSPSIRREPVSRVVSIKKKWRDILNESLDYLERDGSEALNYVLEKGIEALGLPKKKGEDISSRISLPQIRKAV